MLKVLCQVCCRGGDALLRVAAAAQALGPLHEATAAGGAVELGKLCLYSRVTDNQPAATGNIPARRRLLCQVDTAQQHLVGYRTVKVETLAHSAGGTQQGVDLFQVELHVDASSAGSPLPGVA